MYKKHQTFFISFIISFLGILSSVYAQPNVNLVINPNVRIIRIQSEIELTVQTDDPNKPGLQFQWSLEGPGELLGDPHNPGIYYIPPTKVEGESAQATITVTVTDAEGRKTTENVTFTFDVSPPPIPPDIIQLLKKADDYFERRWYTTPKDKNAFDMYKTVLSLDPDNRHAQQKIYEMTRIYKTWGDNAYNRTDYKKAKANYQKYLTVAQYITNTLGDRDIEPEIQEVRKRLKSVGVFILTPTPKPIPPATPTQTPATVLPPIVSIDQLLKEADGYLRAQWLTEPPEKNAFDLYKAVLERAPTNRYAREGLHEITRMCKSWADSDYRRREYSKAERYYRQYLKVAAYILHNLNDRSIEREYWEVKERVEELENQGYRSTSQIPPFQQADVVLSIITDKTVYYDGEFVSVTVQADRDCYLRLYNVTADNQIYQIFPNEWAHDNFIRGGRRVDIPNAADNFDFVVAGPFGIEKIIAEASPEQFDDLKNISWSGSGFPKLTAEPRVIKGNSRAVITYEVRPR